MAVPQDIWSWREIILDLVLSDAQDLKHDVTLVKSVGTLTTVVSNSINM